MKKLLVLLMISLCISFNSESQNEPSLKIKNQRLVVEKSFVSKSGYLDSVFTSGIVVYSDGKAQSGNLNYNLIDGSIHFVGEDTTIYKLAGIENVKQVKYGKRVFEYTFKFGFAELVNSYPDNIEVFVLRKCTNTSKKEDLEIYGSKSAGAEAKKCNSILFMKTNVSSQYIRPNFFEKGNQTEQSIQISMDETYLIKVKGRFYEISNTKDLAKLFPNRKQEIAAAMDTYMFSAFSKPELIYILDSFK